MWLVIEHAVKDGLFTTSIQSSSRELKLSRLVLPYWCQLINIVTER